MKRVVLVLLVVLGAALSAWAIPERTYRRIIFPIENRAYFIPEAATNVPSTADAPGVAGMVTYDAGYVYICVATNTWKRAVLVTWGAPGKMLLETGDEFLLETGDTLLAE